MSSILSLSPGSTTESEAEDGAATPATAATSPDDALPLDVSFDLLQNPRRRRVLQLVMAAEGGTTLADVSEQIAARENDKPRAELDAQERKRVYVGLYQCHLPRMDDAGVVEFDEDGGTVEAGPHAHELAQYLQTATDEDEEPTTAWPRAALLGGAGGLLLGALLTYAVPQALPAVVVLAVFGGGLAFLADFEAHLGGD